jgi:hypothetical protein
MPMTRNTLDTSPGPADWFTGSVFVDAITAPENDWRIGAASVHFTPGARTAWHTHPHGQTIWVTEGVGLCQRHGGPIEVIRPRRPRLFRARREPLARRRTDTVHDPHRHPAGERGGRGRHLGRAGQRRAVRPGAVDYRRAVTRATAAILFPAGFFASSAGRGATQPNKLILLLYLGAAALTAGVLALGIGLLTA